MKTTDISNSAVKMLLKYSVFIYEIKICFMYFDHGNCCTIVNYSAGQLIKLDFIYQPIQPSKVGVCVVSTELFSWLRVFT